MASVMDRILAYESDKYHQQRLISFISSPWDDPFAYSTLYNARFSTYNQVNIEHILPTQELKSGYFASYRLSSLCPDYQHYFTPEQQAALGELLAGLEDADRYSGYLTLLNRYHTLPVLAIGYGFSTARAPITENQPPQNEQEQGQALVERWQDLREAGWAGAFVSTWQDVWDRRSWNTAYTTYHNGVVPWQDVQTDGQCYGLMAFEPGEAETVCQVDGTPDEWTAEDQVLTAQGLSLSMKYDEKYLYFYVDGIQPEEDTLYLPIDTTPKSGSTYCQEHRLSFTRGCDFLIAISGEHNSRVLVQERYEHLWAMYSYETAQENAYLAGKQRAKDSPAFRPIRLLLQQEEPQTLTTWDAMPTYETGRLTYGNANPDAPDFDSLADYCFTDHGVELRIPWQLLNFSNPSEMMIHDDYYECYGVENLHIEEMYVGAAVADDSGARIPMTAFPLEGWGKTVTYHERLKESYYILQAYWRQEEA